MKKNKDQGKSMGMLIGLVSLAAILCVVLGILMYMDNHGMLKDKNDTEESTEEGAGGSDNGSAQNVVSVDGDRQINLDEIIPADKKVNIKELQETVNPDIYAWLYIPDTGIDTPVVQHPEDALYYVNHNVKGEEDPDGAVNSELCNSKNFDDNQTVIYGKNTQDDRFFSKLDIFSDPEFFNSHPYIYVYTENGVFVYERFAAYESDARHLVVFYATYVNEQYYLYLSQLRDKIGLDGNVDDAAWPAYEDKMLSLSTHIPGKEESRYLVQARLIGFKNLQ